MSPKSQTYPVAASVVVFVKTTGSLPQPSVALKVTLGPVKRELIFLEFSFKHPGMLACNLIFCVEVELKAYCKSFIEETDEPFMNQLQDGLEPASKVVVFGKVNS